MRRQCRLPQANQAAADATALDRYVGYYQLNPRAVFTITRTDDQLFAQLTGQRVLPLRPAGNGEYVYGSAALRMSFVSDGQGTMLVLRQHGQDLVSARVDEARAAAVESVFVRQIAEAPDRFREQSPAPGSRDAVLRGIEELQRGAPDYQRMSPPLADGMRRQLGELHTMLTVLGRPGVDFFPRRRSRRLRHLRGQIRQWFWGIQAPDGNGRHDRRRRVSPGRR